MNRATVERLERLELDLDAQAAVREGEEKTRLEAQALQAFRLRQVAEAAERIADAKVALARDLAEAKKHGATLQELADVSGLSVETVRQRIAAVVGGVVSTGSVLA